MMEKAAKEEDKIDHFGKAASTSFLAAGVHIDVFGKKAATADL